MIRGGYRQGVQPSLEKIMYGPSQASMIIDTTLAKLGCTANASAMLASMCG